MTRYLIPAFLLAFALIACDADRDTDVDIEPDRTERKERKKRKKRKPASEADEARDGWSNLIDDLSPGSAESPGDPKVKVLSNGRSPRKRLRHSTKVGHRERMTMVMKMAMDMDMGAGLGSTGATKIPPMVMDMDLTVTKAKPNIRYDYKITDVRMGKGGDPALLGVLGPEIKGLIGAGGHVVVTNRGFTREATFTMPPTAKVGMDELFGGQGGIEDSMKDMSSPLPKEAVGVGAKWKVENPVDANGIAIIQTATYTLKSMAGGDLVLEVAITQKLDPSKKSKLAGIPDLDKVTYSGAGTGTTTMRLDRLTPIKGTSKVNVNLTVSAKSPQPMNIGIKMDLGVEITGRVL